METEGERKIVNSDLVHREHDILEGWVDAVGAAYKVAQKIQKAIVADGNL